MIEIWHRRTNAVLRTVDSDTLRWADLRWADLRWADLRDADLRWADLRGANLAGANLRRADLWGANLWGADLTEANLEGANLRGADLAGTCLDPAASIPPIHDADILVAGLEIDGDHVLGWRTARSQHCGATEYVPGTYIAPVFSVAATECHPGVCLAGRDWLEKHYPSVPLVRVRCQRADLHRAGDKWRARAIDVLPEEDGR